jgi:hypothetical protein
MGAMTQVKIGSVAFSVTFLNSFALERDFLKHCMMAYYPELDEKTRRETLKEVWKINKRLNERPGIKK